MKKELLFAILALGLLLAVFSPFATAAERVQGVAPALKAAQTHEALQEAATVMIKAEEAYARAIDRGLEEWTAQQMLTARMEEALQPEKLVPMFLRSYSSYRQALSAQASLARTAAAPTAYTEITGHITVDGEAPIYPVTVVAFDSMGYYRGDSDDWYTSSTGKYSILNLPPGEYYLLTVSDRYVDEIYNNLILPLDARETWRLAEKVTVSENQMTAGIDFELQKGAELSGMIFREDGSPVQGMTLSFVFTSPDSPVPVYSLETTTDDGFFIINVPLVGDYRLSVQVVGEGSPQTWYPNQAAWAAGQIVALSAYDTSLSNLDFILAPLPVGVIPGSISGNYRWSDTDQLISIATAFLFHAEDSSLADFKLGFLGSYMFPAVAPGEYIVYVDDQLGNLIGGVNYLGQFYSGAQTPGAATRITVREGEEVVLNDIVLQPGGTLTGTVKSAEGKVLDDVWVLAIDASLTELKLEPWLNNLHLFIGKADAKGIYSIAGVPTGHYLLRTISDTLINENLLNLIKITSGAHAGEVVDEWYGGGPNLFNAGSAAAVAVTAPYETAGIDFVLEKAKWIRGRVTDSINGAGKSFYRLFALNDSTAYPFLSLTALIEDSQMDSAGYYRLGPLPSGTYKILAMAPFTGFNNYLSEMYGGARSFADAEVVTVGGSDLTGMDIKVDRGAVIQGFVDLPQEGGGVVRAGADILDGFPVMVYEAASGKLASMDFVQFNGGYRVDRLLPGTYKILALPAVAPFAATWYGGGGSFSSAAEVTLGFGETVDCNILIEKAGGAIAGSVLEIHSGAPLSQVMVIAYHPSGHPAGISMTGMDLNSGLPAGQSGQFTIPGLRAGDYYLRTFALSSALGLSSQLMGFVDLLSPASGEEIDYMNLLFGDGLGDLSGLLGLGMTLYGDQWYRTVPAQIEINLDEFVLNLLAYGMPSGHDEALLPLFLPLPLAEKIPATALPITVADGGTVAGVEFRLEEGGLGDVVSDVEERPAGLPGSFTVHANYPNPFNPATTLSFELPAEGRVRVEIFNALGHRVRLLQEGFLPAGAHRLAWDGRSDAGEPATSGLYFARFQAGNSVRTVKMVMMK
ncbi:MAG TPA: FlgD immunoglobulin-like domain containing protein [bacterium]|nr:FlgD immunoglobulin-like domain containing protein [bacterium]